METTMIIDAIIALIILFFVFIGFKNGFTHTIFHTLGWIAAIIAAVFLQKPFGNFLENHTTIYGHMYDKTEGLLTSLVDKVLGAKTGDASTADSIYGVSNIPGVLNDAMQNATEKVTPIAASQATDILFAIVTFLILLFLTKLVFFTLTAIFSKKYRKKGIVGGLDGLAGAVLGIAQAALLIFALLALLLPVSYIVNPSAYNWVIHSMDRSIFSQYLYENNPLLYLLREYAPTDLLPTEWFAK
jgi:uncharacterized membrane protein required for colicin V production